MSKLQDTIAQEIWQCYVVEVGRSLPEGMADRMAAAVVAELDLSQFYAPVVVDDDGHTWPRWNEWYDDRVQAQKAVADDPGTVLGSAFVTPWTAENPTYRTIIGVSREDEMKYWVVRTPRGTSRRPVMRVEDCRSVRLHWVQTIKSGHHPLSCLRRMGWQGHQARR